MVSQCVWSAYNDTFETRQVLTLVLACSETFSFGKQMKDTLNIKIIISVLHRIAEKADLSFLSSIKRKKIRIISFCVLSHFITSFLKKFNIKMLC